MDDVLAVPVGCLCNLLCDGLCDVLADGLCSLLPAVGAGYASRSAYGNAGSGSREVARKVPREVAVDQEARLARFKRSERVAGESQLQEERKALARERMVKEERRRNWSCKGLQQRAAR